MKINMLKNKGKLEKLHKDNMIKNMESRRISMKMNMIKNKGKQEKQHENEHDKEQGKVGDAA